MRKIYYTLALSMTIVSMTASINACPAKNMNDGAAPRVKKGRHSSYGYGKDGENGDHGQKNKDGQSGGSSK